MEYKYVLINDNSRDPIRVFYNNFYFIKIKIKLKWESGDNRVLHVLKGDSIILNIEDIWEYRKI